MKAIYKKIFPITARNAVKLEDALVAIDTSIQLGEQNGVSENILHAMRKLKDITYKIYWPKKKQKLTIFLRNLHHKSVVSFLICLT